MGQRIAVAAIALTALIAGMVPAAGATAAAASWKVVATPDLGAHPALHAVACPDATTCFAVGAVEHDTTSSSVIARAGTERAGPE